MSFTEAQLQKMLDSCAQEGTYLDFKRGEAMGKSGSLRRELVKVAQGSPMRMGACCCTALLKRK